jgi:uncharacterized protein with LGFP repeats
MQLLLPNASQTGARAREVVPLSVFGFAQGYGAVGPLAHDPKPTVRETTGPTTLNLRCSGAAREELDAAELLKALLRFSGICVESGILQGWY